MGKSAVAIEEPEPKSSTNGNGRKVCPKALGEEQAEAFQRLIESAGTDGKVGLYSHRFPDPDAIGSMMGLSWLLRKVYGLNSDILYHGEVAHPQNKVMCGLLEPQMIRVEDVSQEQVDQYKLRILTDAIPTNAGIGDDLKKKVVHFDCVIDHHKDLPGPDFKGLVLHRKTGSACAIVYDLIKRLVDRETHGWFDGDIDHDSKVATALITGVVTDTGYLLSDDTTELEFQCYTELFPHRDSDSLQQIVFFKRPPFWVHTKAQACGEAKINDEGFAIVGLGLIPDSQRDLIADMAEEMVSWSGVETAIAFGVVGGSRIEGSVRSQSAALNVADFCKKFGKGDGGGKHGKGAYRISLGGLSIDLEAEDEVDVKEAWDSINKREIKRIQRTIKK